MPHFIISIFEFSPIGKLTHKLNNPIKVLLVDDHAIVRNGIIAILEEFPEIEIVGQVSNGSEAIDYLQNHEAPKIIITDLKMPIMGGLDLISNVKTSFQHINVIVLSGIDELQEILMCFEAGASAYLLKNVSVYEIVFAINQAAIGYQHLSTGIALKLLGENGFNKNFKPDLSNLNITKREIEILYLIADGYTNSEIAEKLFTSKRTIEGYRQNLLDKTGKKNTASLINYVVRNGIID